MVKSTPLTDRWRKGGGCIEGRNRGKGWRLGREADKKRVIDAELETDTEKK